MISSVDNVTIEQSALGRKSHKLPDPMTTTFYIDHSMALLEAYELTDSS